MKSVFFKIRGFNSLMYPAISVCVLLSFNKIKGHLPFIWWIFKDYKMLTHQSQRTPNLHSILFDFKMLMKMAVSMQQQRLAHYNFPF